MNYSDIELLEKRRYEAIKFSVFITLIFFSIILLQIFIIIYFKVAPEWISMSLLIPSLLLPIYCLAMLASGIFDFDKEVKKLLMKDIIENIIGDNGEIAWSDKQSISTNKFRGFISLFLDKKRKNIDIIPDEQFNGSYKDTDFSASEMLVRRKIGSGRRRKYITIFKGLAIEINLKNGDFSPTIFKRRYFGHPIIIKGFKKVRFKELFGNKYNAYLKEGEKYSEFPSSFYKYLSSINKNISFGFIENKALILIPAVFDMFKLGSTFKKVNDKKQYQKFRNEFQFMLNLIENLSNIMKDENI